MIFPQKQTYPMCFIIKDSMFSMIWKLRKILSQYRYYGQM